VALHIRQLTLTDFRNYRALRLEPGPGLIVLSGANGAGKTNLLEAVSLLAPGRGLRRAPFADIARADNGDAAKRWAVAAEVETPDGTVKLGTGWQSGADDGRSAARQVRIDGIDQKGSGALGGYVRVLWLTPAMDRLFSGPAGDRRRFLDRLVMVFDPEHGTRVSRFEKSMRERNRLLERRNAEASWLAGIELQMAEAAIAIAAARGEAVRALDHVLRPRDGAANGLFPWPLLRIEGTIEADLERFSAVDAEDRYRRMLADSRALDRAAGRTTKGPHRSDLHVRHGTKEIAAHQCSTGEQKALLVATILGHARLVANLDGGSPPILLLDEVAAHLDPARREGLFDMLQALGAQVWMTGTDAELFATVDGGADHYTVSAGAVVAG